MPLPKQNGYTRRALAVKVWKRADAVCFDVDSTLIQEEGIDCLAAYCGVGRKVAEWTKKAMGGSVTFREALGARLNIIKPTLQQMYDFNKMKKPADILTPGIEALVAQLHAREATVYLVSGGFRSFIEPLADHLDIPRENIYANRILFDEEGNYAGFDETEPTSSSGGKPRVVAQLKKEHDIIVMIGDGATDMEASPPADAFIGFGGNVVREKVKAGAAWYIYKIQDLIDELNSDDREQEQLLAQRQVLQGLQRLEIHGEATATPIGSIRCNGDSTPIVSAFAVNAN